MLVVVLLLILFIVELGPGQVASDGVNDEK